MKHVTGISNYKKIIPPCPLFLRVLQTPQRLKGKSRGRGGADPILSGRSWGLGEEQHTRGKNLLRDTPNI